MLPYNNKNIVSIFDLSYTEICDKLSINPITAKSKYFVLTETPPGTTTKKYGYWLNAKYIKKSGCKTANHSGATPAVRHCVFGRFHVSQTGHLR